MLQSIRLFQFDYIEFHDACLTNVDIEDFLMNLQCTNLTLAMDTLSSEQKKSFIRGLNRRKFPINIFVNRCEFKFFKQLCKHLNQEVLFHVTVRLIRIEKLKDLIDFVSSQKKKMKRIYFSSLNRIPFLKYKDNIEKLSIATFFDDFRQLKDDAKEKLFFFNENA